MQLHLAVAILKHTSNAPAGDPIVYLSGGPGGPALQRDMQEWTIGLAAPLQEHHDIVFFDPRGTGLSTPSLACPEEIDARREALSRQPQPFGRLGGLLYNTPLYSCLERLKGIGIDPRAYSSATVAVDVTDLMTALGYHEFDLFGISYGARVALTLIRDAPERVGRAILDSTVPVQVNTQLAVPANFQRALDAIQHACAVDARCTAAYGDLTRLWQVALAKVEMRPVELDVRNVVTGMQLHVVLDASRFITASLRFMYNTANSERFPQLLHRFVAGDEAAVMPLADVLAFGDDEIASGMSTSVECNEEIPFYTADAATEAQKNVSFDVNAALAWYGQALKDTVAFCWGWDEAAPPDRENRAVASSIPALILAGTLDPVTPPSWGQLAAESLSRSTVVEFPGTAHGVLYARPGCAGPMIASFLDSGSADESCLGSIRPSFAPPAAP